MGEIISGREVEDAESLYAGCEEFRWFGLASSQHGLSRAIIITKDEGVVQDGLNPEESGESLTRAHTDSQRYLTMSRLFELRALGSRNLSVGHGQRIRRFRVPVQEAEERRNHCHWQWTWWFGFKLSAAAT